MTTSALDKLSPKRQRFVREYIVDLNGAQAAIRAGYSSKGARQQAARLLADVNVRAAVAELQAAAAKRNDITVDYIIGELQENHRLARIGNPLTDRYGKPTGEYMRNLAASNKALDQIAELSGFKVERRAVVVKSITDMSEDQLLDAEAELEALIERDSAKKDGEMVH